MADKFAKSFNFGGEDDFYPLPIVTAVDNGKVMKVVEGEWIMGELILGSVSYLSFIGNENFTLKTKNTSKNWDGTIQYSTDLINWYTWTGSEISSSNYELYLRGTGNTRMYDPSIETASLMTHNCFVFTGSDNLKISCVGNIEVLLDYTTVMNGGHPTMAAYCYSNMFYNCSSLVAAPELPATTLSASCYRNMFYNCSSLVAAPELPATTLSASCYSNMFYGCSSLVAAPELPATTLSASCYSNMFYGCSSLVAAPELPATTLAIGCYSNMFRGCSSLVTAPSVLPATTLATNCYYCMFYNCSSLATAPSVLPATTLSDRCYYYMFYGCSSLVAAPELPATTLATECYRGMFYGCSSLVTAPSVLPATTLAIGCYRFMFEFTAIDAIPRIMATTYETDSCKGMFDDIKTLNIYSSPTGEHTYGWTAPNASYTSGMFGSDDREITWAQLDGANFPNSGTPTEGTTYYFKLAT